MKFPTFPTLHFRFPQFPVITVDPCATVTAGVTHCGFSIPNVGQLPQWVASIGYDIVQGIVSYILQWMYFIPAVLGFYFLGFVSTFQGDAILVLKMLTTAIQKIISGEVQIGEEVSKTTGIPAPIIASVIAGITIIIAILVVFAIIKGAQAVVNLA